MKKRVIIAVAVVLVIAAAIAISGSVLAMGIYSVYIKKKRSRDYRLRDKAARIEKETKN